MTISLLNEWQSLFLVTKTDTNSVGILNTAHSSLDFLLSRAHCGQAFGKLIRAKENTSGVYVSDKVVECVQSCEGENEEEERRKQRSESFCILIFQAGRTKEGNGEQRQRSGRIKR